MNDWNTESSAPSPQQALANANWLPWPRKPIGKRPYKGLGPKYPHHGLQVANSRAKRKVK